MASGGSRRESNGFEESVLDSLTWEKGIDGRAIDETSVFKDKLILSIQRF